MAKRIDNVLTFLKGYLPAAYGEVQFHYELDGEPDEPKEWYHAFVDAFVQAEDLNDRPLVIACRKALIEVGWYVPMTEWDLKNSKTTRGTVWEFKLNGVPYWNKTGGDLRKWLAQETV